MTSTASKRASIRQHAAPSCRLSLLSRSLLASFLGLAVLGALQPAAAANTFYTDPGVINDKNFSKLTDLILQDTIDTNFDKDLKTQGLTAVTGGFIRMNASSDGKKYTYTGAAGYRDLNEDGTGNKANLAQDGDAMRVGSQSKTYIGTLAMRLVAANAMSLDDTLGELNEKYNLGIDLSIAPEAANVTVKQILTMSSGIADYLHVPYSNKEGTWNSFSDYWQEKDRLTTITPQELINLGLTGYPTNGSEGYDGSYSNTNCAIIGLIAEKFYGEKLSTILTENVFNAAGLGEQIWFPTTKDLTETIGSNKYINGYINGSNGQMSDTTETDPSVPWAAGAVVATAEGQLLWLDELINNSHNLVEADLYAQRLISAMWQDGAGRNIVNVSSFRTQYGYYLYTMTSPVTGQDMIGHAGSITGYTSMLAYFPHLDTGLVINVAGGLYNNSGITTTVAAPFFSLELALTREAYQSGSRLVSSDGKTVEYKGGSAQFYAGKPDLEVGTRGVVRLDTETVGGGSNPSVVNIYSTNRTVTYTEPETIPYVAQVVTEIDPTITFYGRGTGLATDKTDGNSSEQMDSWDHAFDVKTGGTINLLANARIEARGARTTALHSDGGTLNVDGEAAAYGQDAYGVSVGSGKANISGLAWAQGLDAAGLFVEGGSATLTGEARGSWGANGLLMTGGEVTVDGGFVTASTIASGEKYKVDAVEMSGGTLVVKNGGVVAADFSLSTPNLALNMKGADSSTSSSGKATFESGSLLSGLVYMYGGSLTMGEGSTYSINLLALESTETKASRDGSTYAFTLSGNNATVTFEKGSTLLLEGAKLNSEYDLTNGAIDFKPATLSFGTYLLEGEYDSAKGTVVVSGMDDAALWSLDGMSGKKASALESLFTSGLDQSSSNGGYRFMSRLFDERYASKSEAVRTWHKAAAPGAMLGYAAAARQVADQMHSQVEERIRAKLNNAEFKDPELTPAAGSLWASVWYSRNDADGFDATGGSAAYDTDARGAVFGVDFTRDAWTIGGALHAGAFDTDGTDGVNLKSEGTFMGASFYSAYAMNDWALTADLGAARYDMDVSGGVLNGLAFESVSADIDAYSLSAGFKAEKRIAEAGPVGLSADAGVRFLHFHQSDYSVAISGDTSFRTSTDDVQQWTFPIGFTASGKVVSGEWTFTPSAALHYVYAAGDRAEESESRFAFGAAGTADFSAAFTDRHSMTAGLGLEARTDRMAFAFTAGADSISSNQKAWTTGIRAQFLF